MIHYGSDTATQIAQASIKIPSRFQLVRRGKAGRVSLSSFTDRPQKVCFKSALWRRSIFQLSALLGRLIIWPIPVVRVVFSPSSIYLPKIFFISLAFPFSACFPSFFQVVLSILAGRYFTSTRFSSLARLSLYFLGVFASIPTAIFSRCAGLYFTALSATTPLAVSVTTGLCSKLMFIHAERVLSRWVLVRFVGVSKAPFRAVPAC